jgi:transcriptional regulator with XRE-family HTH domain
MPTRSSGAEIRRLREEQGITCSQLADNVGIDPSFMWKIENDKMDGSPRTRLDIAAALGVAVGDITYFEPPRPRVRRTKQAA